MPVVRRFEFDLSFDVPRVAVLAKALEPEAPPPEPEPEPEPPPPPEPTFSKDELDAAYERGMMTGRQAGEIDAMTGIERRLADTTEQLAHRLHDFAQSHKCAIAQVERQATEVSLMALRKIFPAFLARAHTTELEALFGDAFEHAIEEPRVLVRTSPAMRGALEPLVRATADQAGFEGKLSIIDDPRLAETDCRIEWADGGVEHDPQRLMDVIEAAVARGLADFDRQLAPNGAGTAGAIEETAQ
jgi:flagellar assembly protein FliH